MVLICIQKQSFAQTTVIYKSDAVAVIKPAVFLDSLPVELDNSFFDVDKIESIDVPKNTASSKIYIKSKDSKSFNFLSYLSLKNIYFNGVNKPVLLLINGKFINNFVQINIDSSYIYKVEVECGDDLKELKNLYRNFAIVNIK